MQFCNICDAEDDELHSCGSCGAEVCERCLSHIKSFCVECGN